MKRSWAGPLVLLASALWISACAHAKPKPSERDWRAANIHKIVVVCVQGDPAADRRVESALIPQFRHQGFDAVAVRDFFPPASGYSPQGLMDLMQRAQVDGIMEITYSGEIPADGIPQQFRFNYHSIKGHASKLSNFIRPLNPALITLMGA